MFKSFYEDCFQVIATGSDRRVAHFGDISGKPAAKYGAGRGDYGRLHPRYLHPGRGCLSGYAGEVKPVDAFGRWRLVDFECPVTLGDAESDVDVFPGDGVFADRASVMIP